MYYKFGVDKVLLRTGKIFGIVAYILLVLQPVFITRLTFFHKIFKLKSLIAFHRANALILLIAAIMHPIFVLASNHFVFFPFELRYWPEFLGMVLLFVLIVTIAISYWQKKIGLSQKTWMLIHRVLAPVIMLMLFFHIFNVSKTFDSDMPFYALILSAAITVFLLFKKYIGRVKHKKSIMENE